MGKEILKLQNGSDIRGIAMNGVEGEDVNLTRYNALAIGAAFAHWLGFKVGKNSFDLKICVGRDPRITGPDLADSLMSGCPGWRCWARFHTGDVYVDNYAIL